MVLLPHFPGEFQVNNFFFSQGKATYLCTGSQVLYSHCQRLYKEKEPANVVSILKEKVWSSHLSLHEKKCVLRLLGVQCLPPSQLKV